MNLELVCARGMMAIISCVVCLGCVALAEFGDNFVVFQERQILYIKVCMISSAVACVSKITMWQSIGMGIVFGALLFACITDYTQCQAYHFTWWIAGSVVMIWLVVAICGGQQIPWMELVIFCVLQELFFARLYGKADCHAFCVCAAVYTMLGEGMLCYLCHMALALVFLSGIQWKNKNITRSGNLKKPVAFIPYIVLAFTMIYIVITCEIFPLNKYSY